MDEDLSQLTDAQLRLAAALDDARQEQIKMASRRGGQDSPSGEHAATVARMKEAHAKLLLELEKLQRIAPETPPRPTRWAPE